MQPEARTRVVLLGASNVARSVSTVVQTARLVLGTPLEILAAIGHGRSYGRRSGAFVREVPGILDCGLWQALERVLARSGTCALVTDVGNDLMFGERVETLVGWVDAVSARLRAMDARIALTQIPCESVSRVGRLRFRFAKAMLFPHSDVRHAEALRAARALAGEMERLAERHGLGLTRLPARWYGLDPIHVRMRAWPEAWPEILRPWAPDREAPRARGSLARWARLRRAMPERWWLLGLERRTPQPAVRFKDGTTVSFY